MSKLVVANWKMNVDLNTAMTICRQLENSDIIKNSLIRSLIIAPPLPYLGYLALNFRAMTFASQDVSEIEEDYGPYTGQVSAAAIESCGVYYAIIGHAESRSFYNLTNIQLKTKIKMCIKHRITPILCVGENNETRQQRTYLDFIVNQIIQCMSDDIDITRLIIAYEPLWTIGTSMSLYLSLIQEVVQKIKGIGIPCVLYGGSVNQDNVQPILQISDGVLLGRASVNINELINIIKTSNL